MNSMAAKLVDIFPESMRGTVMARAFGLFKIPLIFWVRPSVIPSNDENTTIVKIPLNRRTKNHLNSMYFGVLATGADLAGGLAAMSMIQRSGKNVSLAFKDFKAEFHKRAESDVHFTCSEGEKIKEFVDKVLASDERHHMPVHITATCPDKLGDEPVATFTLTLSLKKKG